MSKEIWIIAFFLLAGAATPAQDLSPANVSTYLGNSKWSWTIFITGSKDVLDTVSYVEYTLHPTFSDPVQRRDRGSDPRYPFGLTATGWGVFEVRIKVVFKNDQVRYMTHMLQFVPASTQIRDDWTKHRPTLTIFYGYSATWKMDKKGQYVFVSPGDFKSQTKQVPPETKWSLEIQHEGDAIQFRHGATYYLLSVIRVLTKQKPFNYLDVQVCERPPLSAK